MNAIKAVSEGLLAFALVMIGVAAISVVLALALDTYIGHELLKAAIVLLAIYGAARWIGEH